MASLLAARRQHFAATLRLHACAEAVRLGASAFPRLKCALWQNNPPSLPAICYFRFASAICNTRSRSRLFHPQRQRSPLAPSLAAFESLSVFDPYSHGQENEKGLQLVCPSTLFTCSDSPASLSCRGVSSVRKVREHAIFEMDRCGFLHVFDLQLEQFASSREASREARSQDSPQRSGETETNFAA